MDIKDLIKLTEMGWTKEEILSLAGNNTEEPAPAEEQPAPEEQPAAAPAAPAKDERIDTILDKLDKIASGIQTNAIRAARMPERESADDALAKIINPQDKKEE